MIPGSTTGSLEFLDIVLNKPFKNYLWKECEAWSLYETLSLAPNGKIERTSTSQAQSGFKSTGRRSQENLMVQSFNNCCIT